MSELIIPTEREDVFLRQVTETEDVAWFLGNRMFTHPAPPNQVDAPDHVAFRRLRQQRRKNEEGGNKSLFTGIWDRDTFAGFADLYDIHGQMTTTIGCRLLTDQRGNGYGTIALRAISAYAFTELDLASIEACIKPHNEKSQRMAERAGFEMVDTSMSGLIYRLEPPPAEIEKLAA